MHPSPRRGSPRAGRGILRDTYTVKTVATEIQSPKLTEFKSIYVAFQVGARPQQPVLTGIFSSIQSFFDGTCDLSRVLLNLSWYIFYSATNGRGRREPPRTVRHRERPIGRGEWEGIPKFQLYDLSAEGSAGNG